jgi:hypothetical protein
MSGYVLADVTSVNDPGLYQRYQTAPPGLCAKPRQ